MGELLIDSVGFYGLSAIWNVGFTLDVLLRSKFSEARCHNMGLRICSGLGGRG